MEKPFAITLNVSSSLANKTGNWLFPSVPSTCTACRPATRAARPARTSAVALRRRGGWRRVRARLAADHGGQPVPGRDGQVCYHLRVGLPSRAQLGEAVGINSVERFLGDEAIRAGAWTSRRRRPASGCS